MKLLHTTTTTLNTRNFNKVSEDIISTLYTVSPEMQDIYDIHINYIDDSWRIDFIPFNDNLPVLKVDTYVDFKDNGSQTLRVDPTGLEKFPTSFNLKDRNKSYDLCVNYMAIFDFIVSLYDYEYTF